MQKPLTSGKGVAWWKIAALLLLSVVPVAAGIVRLLGLEPGRVITLQNARFFYAPLPIFIHILCAGVFCVFGAFQFDAQIRRRYLTLHRISGRILVVCGAFSGLTGIWMTIFYQIPPSLQGGLLYGTRLVFGSLMVLFIALSLFAILSKRVTGHRAWMIRAYAIGQGAGTQVLIIAPGSIIFGETLGLTRDILMSSAWVINLIFAEWIINRQRAK